MAQFVFTNPKVTINTVDLSDHVKRVVLNYGADMLDDTVAGDTTRSRIGGLLDWSIEVEFIQDFAAAKVDATLFTLVGATTALTVQPVNAAISATNPEFQGTGCLESYGPMGNAIGELASTRAVFQSAGTLVRDITP